LRLINETAWRTDQLRALVAETAQRTLDPEHRKRLTVLVNYAKGGSYSGHAFLGPVYGGKHKVNGYFAKVHVPSPRAAQMRLAIAERLYAEGKTDAADVFRSSAMTAGHLNTRTFAAILTHELLHTLGHGHTRESGATMNRHTSGAETERAAWADAFSVQIALLKPKVPLADRETKRIAHYTTMLAKWTTKARRAETVRKGWARRLAMAESRLGREAAKK
jgi:hypothetical protein